MEYVCIRECLVQSRRHNLNRPFRPGNKLTVDFELDKELPSIARFFRLRPGTEAGVLMSEGPKVNPPENEKELLRMNKSALFLMAEEKGHVPNDDMTKADIIDLILGRRKDPVFDAMGANREPPPAPTIESLEAPEGE